jgi:hypothetical protein
VLRTRIGITVALYALAGCGEDPPSAAAGPEPAAASPAVTAKVTPTVPGSDALPNACATPGVQKVALEAGVVTTTPWGLELTYAINEDDKAGPGYMFLLRHGARRGNTRRDAGNWTSAIMWRGFCWRGGARPEKRASKVEIEMAPSCKEGKLFEAGDCAAVLASAR